MIDDEKKQRFIAIARQSGKSTATAADAFVAFAERYVGPLSKYQKQVLWCWYYRQHRP